MNPRRAFHFVHSSLVPSYTSDGRPCLSNHYIMEDGHQMRRNLTGDRIEVLFPWGQQDPEPV